MTIPTPEELAIIFSQAQSEFALSSWMSSPRSQAAAGCAAVTNAVLEGAAQEAGRQDVAAFGLNGMDTMAQSWLTAEYWLRSLKGGPS